MSRKPKVGDFIYFDVEKQANGKSRAINCRIEGVAAKAIQRHQPRMHKNTSVPKSKVVLIVAVIAIGAFGYQRLGLSTATTPNTVTPNSPLNRTFSESNANFSCDGRQHCSQMTSRAEAEYFTKHCPDTKWMVTTMVSLVKMTLDFNINMNEKKTVDVVFVTV